MTDIPDPNAAVISTAQTAASDVGAAIGDGAAKLSTAIQADASRLAVKDEAKAEGFLHREWDALKAEMHAVLAQMEAYVKAKL